MPGKRPFRTLLLLFLAFLFTAWNLLRAWTAFAWQDSLNEFSVEPAGWVIMVSGLIWGVVGLLLIWTIWKKRDGSRKILLWAAAGYSAWYWAEGLFWQFPRPNWRFAVILNLVPFVFIILLTKSSMREAHERKS